MPAVQLHTEEDIADFVRGNDFMSASGGGRTSDSLAHLKEDLQSGSVIRWIDMSELADDAWVASVWFSGSIAPNRYNRAPVEAEYGLTATVSRPLLAALDRLERYLGVTFDALI